MKINQAIQCPYTWGRWTAVLVWGCNYDWPRSKAMVPFLPLPGTGIGSNSRMRKVSKSSAALVRVVLPPQWRHTQEIISFCASGHYNKTLTLGTPLFPVMELTWWNAGLRAERYREPGTLMILLTSHFLAPRAVLCWDFLCEIMAFPEYVSQLLQHFLWPAAKSIFSNTNYFREEFNILSSLNSLTETSR